MFVVVEGIEGSGKSTLLSGLADAARAQGRDVVTTREPGGTALGNRLRALFVDPETEIDAMAEAFLVSASRAQHVAEIIEPALRAGRLVLCDRFAAATLAYQGYGRGIDLALLRDLTRADGVAADRLEREGRAFHERVRDGYLALARSDPRFVTLDGSLPAARVLRAATTALAAKLDA